ncbi:MAG: PDZ domain-containing protein [Sandaracinaceae bacterium]|nr:PDZ domain-containing protein [Sandaracinaceae bacterium]
MKQAFFQFSSVGCLLVVVLAGCAYPRRTVSLTEVADADSAAAEAPSDVWSLHILNAQLQPEQRGGLNWDEDGTLADPFVRILRNGVLVWQTPVVQNSINPEWNAVLPENIWAPSDQTLRFEVWDKDQVIRNEGLAGDPIGVVQFQGLPPNALRDAVATLRLEGNATLQIQVTAPRPRRGIGITRIEERANALIALEVIERSPAGRAGLHARDKIVRIDGERVADIGPERAASALSLAGIRGGQLEVLSGDSDTPRIVELDRGYVWLTM